MSPEKKQTLKLLKVDNWSVFLLHRLQLMYAKGDCCDLTLKFEDHRELKVHKLVLTTCTKYFENIKHANSFIKMPASLTYTSMLPIINFMYSGKLEFKPELQESLLDAAKILNMAILVQLLVAQKSPSDGKIKLAAKIDDTRKYTKKPLPIDHSQMTTGPISMLAEKKLPFWKKRAYPLMHFPDKKEYEDPRPTRFELPSDETSSLMMNVPSFNEISYESEPVVPSPVDFPVRERSLESGIKRRVAPPPSGPSHPKSQKLTESQIISGNWSDEDDDAHFENIHSYEDSDDDIEPITNVPEKIVTSTPKPILKPAADTSAASSAKKVRFNLSKEDKENTEANSGTRLATVVEPQPAPSPIPRTPPSKPAIKIPENPVKINAPTENEKPKEESVPNHAKIIAEVIKKFPDLVKNNKNIKLKITSPAGVKTVSLDCTKSPAPATKSSVLVVKPNMIKIEQQSPVEYCKEAENTTGPWVCKRCIIEDTKRRPVFDTYYSFRKHLIDIHMEKIDPKICELCGYKASKKNLHLFHLYTKHRVQPPKNIKFPKCTLCKYVALNEALLTKHYATHQVNNRELICNICKLSFKSANSFQAHCVTCKPNSEIRTYPCKNCNKVFRTSVSMKAHLKDCRVVDNTQLRNVEPVEMIEVPLLNTEGKAEHSLVQLPPGIIVADSPNMALLHPDGNGLSNVASGIPNIGFTVLPEDHQTVILLDENSDFFLQGNNSVVMAGENNDEYVVPEILQDNMAQLYSASNISYTTVNGTSVITYPVMHVQQDGGLSGHPQNAITSIPVNQNTEVFVSDKEITISDDISNMKPHLDPNKVVSEMDRGKNDIIVARHGEQQVVKDPVTSNTCIVRIGNDSMNMNDSVCLVDSNTPISIIEQGNDNVNINMNTPVSIVDADAPISIVGSDTCVSIIHPDNVLNSNDVKPSVISIAPHQAVPLPVPQTTKVKVDQISTEWDFDAEEEDEDITDDPDSRPSRPSIELQEIV